MKLIVRLEMTKTKHIWNTLMQFRSDFTDLKGKKASYFLDKIIQKRPQCIFKAMDNNSTFFRRMNISHFTCQINHLENI